MTNEPDIYRPSAAIDPQRLDYLWTLAERIARGSLVPESLRTKGNKNNKKDLDPEEVVANVFAVVEQADRWNQSPFALLACSAIVHGKLGFEGKVIGAVLESQFGITLHHYFTGDPQKDNYHIYLSDKELPDEVIDELEPGYRHARFKIMDGSVAEWKTTGDGSPWRPATYGKMLVYRGEREWARVYKPAAILGVLGDDEILAIGMERQAQLARDVTPSLADRFSGGRKADGFNPDNVKQLEHNSQAPMEIIDRRTGEIIESGAQREATGRETSSAKAASAKPASTDAGRGGATSEKDSRPNSSSESASEDKSAGSGEQFPRLSADAFRKYAGNLARADSVKTLERVDKEFWEEHGMPRKGSPDYTLGGAIYKKQLARANGQASADGLLDEIFAEIDASYGIKEDDL